MRTPEEIDYGVLFLASDESSYMTGTPLIIDVGDKNSQRRDIERTKRMATEWRS